MAPNLLNDNDLDFIINTKIRPPEQSKVIGKKMSSTSQSTITIPITGHPDRLYYKTKSLFNIYFLNILIWTIILLSQSTKANSVFLESCSASNINQVFCHNDALYVIQDNVLYYGNSCGQMMTNETIRVTKKFKTGVAMKTAFIDDKSSIFLFSNNLVLTSHLDNRNVAELNNISQVILDYYGSVKYTVFEPTLKHVYVIDKDNKMHIFNTKIFSHTGSIKWGKDQSNMNTFDLKDYPFEYFFFAGRDLYAKLKGVEKFMLIRDFGYCLAKINDFRSLPDFEHCFRTYNSREYLRHLPLKVLVCTEIQYLIWVILLLVVLFILLCCCLRCCFGYFSDKEKGGKSYYVKDNEDRFLRKLFRRYPKDKFNQFVNLYKKNEVNPVKLDPNSMETKPTKLDLEYGKNGYLNEAHYPSEIKYNTMTNAPMEIKTKDVVDVKNNLRKSLPREHMSRQMRPVEYKPPLQDYPFTTRIPINVNDKIIYADANSNYERSSLILEDYAENRPDIDLKEPRPYSSEPKRPPRPYKPAYLTRPTPAKVEEPYIVNQQIKPFQYDQKQFSPYQQSSPISSPTQKQQPTQFPYQSSTYNREVEVTNSSSYQHASYSFSKFVPKIFNMFSPKDAESKTNKTRF